MATAPSHRLGLAIVRNESMLPSLRAGDRLLLRYGRTPRPGDVVVARLPDGTVVVKRAHEERATGWWLLSDNADVGLGDSRAWGPIPASQVLAVVLMRVWPRPGRVARWTVS